MIFGMVLMIQEPEITHYCFGVCGKVTLAGIDSDVAGPLVPCMQDFCEYEEKRSDGPIGEAFDEELYIRKLIPCPA